MREEFVKLYHLGSWYKVYEDDARVVSSIINYKLFEDPKTGKLCVGFPDYLIDNILYMLKVCSVSYILPNDDNFIKDFGIHNNYNKYLKYSLPISYVRKDFNVKKNIKGTFTIKFENDNEEIYEIGNNISSDAKLVSLVMKNNIGDKVFINGEYFYIIEKNIID